MRNEPLRDMLMVTLAVVAFIVPFAVGVPISLNTGNPVYGFFVTLGLFLAEGWAVAIVKHRQGDR